MRIYMSRHCLFPSVQCLWPFANSPLLIGSVGAGQDPGGEPDPGAALRPRGPLTAPCDARGPGPPVH